MNQPIKLILGGAIFCLPMLFTSCGNIDNPLEEIISSIAPSTTVKSLTLSKSELVIAKGNTAILTDIVDPSGTAVEWGSDNLAVATVADGVITAVAVGTAVITAKAGDKTATCEVTVIDMLVTPLTLEAAEAGAVVTFKTSDDAVAKNIDYSKDGGLTWTTEQSTGGEGVKVTLEHIGDKVMFRGANAAYAVSSSSYNNISCDKNCYVYGNIMSLVDKDNFAINTTLTASSTFRRLFYGYPSNKIVSHDTKTLELPAKDLTDYCYTEMFGGCSLETAPKLPAESLAVSCYEGMFVRCSSLKEAWVKADYTDDHDECEDMFDGCSDTGTLHTASTSSHWAVSGDIPTNWQVKNDF